MESCNRVDLWKLLSSRILDQNLDSFKSLIVSVLSEPDPSFDLSPDERFAAAIHGKVLSYSQELRKGMAEGLAILGNYSNECINSSQGKAETICLLVIRELLTDADWVRWGSLNDLLPTLAESGPGEFLISVEKALRSDPTPFNELFAQEGSGITGSNYLTGLLWALEGLAWEEQFLVRVCVSLGELASHDPGGQWGNRPSNSLRTILLPWMPQTLASVEKRKVAVQTLLNEWPNIAWNLIIQFLPGQHQSTSGSYKPNWRKVIPDDWEKGVTNKEYWQQVSFYAEFAVEIAGQDIQRLSILIDHFDNLPKPAFEHLVKLLASQPVIEFPEEQKMVLWVHLNSFTKRHRKFSDAKWALPDELIARIENISVKLTPTNPFYLYQYLFTDSEFDLYEENGDWKEQQKKLDARREKAIRKIFQLNGIDGVVKFSEAVAFPDRVGTALGSMSDKSIDEAILPFFLDKADEKKKALVKGFVWRRHYINGWGWCDNIDKSDWTIGQLGHFLACLPFAKEAWDRASEWLQESQGEYWTRTDARGYPDDEIFIIAIDKFIEYGRPFSAIQFLDMMRDAKFKINVDQCIRALLSAVSSSELVNSMDGYHITELIKFLQSESSVKQADLFRVEWAYLPLLNRRNGAVPKFLESKLANDPEFFCEVIRLVYRSKNEAQASKDFSEKSKALATNAWELLHEWKTPPGTQEDGAFSEVSFDKWLKRVNVLCTESGHLEVALITIGKVLIYAPSDPNGLWIHRAIATALNDRDSDEMRHGFEMGTYNSRGAHFVDPTGKQEKELAEQFRGKAEAVENAGFQRFAVTLRDLATSYERDAEGIISRHKNRNSLNS